MSRRRQRAAEGTTIEIGARGLLLGVVAIGALVALFVLLRQAGGRTTEAPPAAPAASAVPEAGTWLTAAGEPAIGSTRAPVTLIVYTDFQCPNCRQFATEVVPWLKTSWLRDGFVKVIVRDFAVRGNESYLAAEAAHCAGEQGRYWSYHDALFAAQSGENQGTFAAERLVALADGLRLERAAFAACVAAGRYRGRVQASTEAAAAQGFEGTPTFLVNGHRLQGAIALDKWSELFTAFAQDFARAATVAPPAPAAPAGATP